jgi:hypothetical protein
MHSPQGRTAGLSVDSSPTASTTLSTRRVKPALPVWPRIITVVHPDASDIAYDNLLLASISAMTSGGTAGYARETEMISLRAQLASRPRALP